MANVLAHEAIVCHGPVSSTHWVKKADNPTKIVRLIMSPQVKKCAQVDLNNEQEVNESACTPFDNCSGLETCSECQDIIN